MSDQELMDSINKLVVINSKKEKMSNIIIIPAKHWLKLEIMMTEYDRDIATDKKTRRFFNYTLRYMRRKLKLLKDKKNT